MGGDMPTRRTPDDRPRRSFFCNACGRKVRMPEGWSPGSASRRHYWAKHPEIMRGKGGKDR